MNKFETFYGLILACFLLCSIGCSETIKDSRMVKLNSAIKMMTNNPPASDSTANSIKNILSLASYDGFNSDSFEYFTDTTSTRALVLVRVPDLNTLIISKRAIFLNLIDKMSSKNSWSNKEKYIGLFGKRNLMLCKTPTQTYNENTLSKDYLLNYYGDYSPKK